MEWVYAIGRFLGAIFKAILPDLIKASKDPTEVRPVGYDDELDKDFDEGFESDIADGEYGFLSPGVHPVDQTQPTLWAHLGGCKFFVGVDVMTSTPLTHDDCSCASLKKE